MGWTATYFTSIIIEGNTAQTGIFFYSGLPAAGNLIGSWAALGGTDAFGNAYPTGINVQSGTLTGVGITTASIIASTIVNSAISASTMKSSAITGGTMTETVVTFDSGGGGLWMYSTSTTTQTFTSSGTFTGPTASVTSLNVQVWGADAGGGGGSNTEGGEGGGAGEYAQEPNYPNYNPGGSYQVQVGTGGLGGQTFSGGTSGGQSSFDNTGVQAQGGQAGSNFIGGPGGNYATASIHYPGGTGGNPAGFAASAGGGGRAGSTGAGGNGGNATGNSSPGAAGAAGTGTGGLAGGAGVNASTNGNNGGGGSGAGEGSAGTTYITKTYTPTSTASYYGAGVGSGLRNNNGQMFQGCPNTGLNNFPGDQFSYANYNHTQIAADFSGATIDSVQLKVFNIHSWYNSGCYLILSYADSGGDHYTGDYYWTNENATSTIDVSAPLNGVIKTLLAIKFGPSANSGNATSLYNYGYYTGGTGSGSHSLTVKGHIGSTGNFTAGNGANGKVIVSYQSSNALVGGLSPVVTTDGAGNALAVGYTGPVQAITPGSSPATVETWHTLTVPTTGTNCTAVSGTARYKLMAEHNAVWLDVQLALTSTGDFTIVMSTTLPATYRPTGTRRPPGATSGTLTSDNSSRLYVDTTGSVQAIGPNGGTSFSFSGMLPLD